MPRLLYELCLRSASRTPEAVALRDRGRTLHHGELAQAIDGVAAGLLALGVERHGRVGVYLPKQLEAVIAMFGAARAGAAFVPINPVLRPAQVGYLARDCELEILVTSTRRWQDLRGDFAALPALRHVVVVDPPGPADDPDPRLVPWAQLVATPPRAGHRVIESDLVAILYTSGSTGLPKGVVLSHTNLVTGAHSVASYLDNRPDDRLLAVLPLSFDYGFSQLTTAFAVGASVVLLEYLLPHEVLRTMAREAVTGLAGVPPLWAQLAGLTWPADSVAALRYLTNSGGAMPRATLAQLRARAPAAQVFLMYGLTEAFRSTFLPPAELDRRPDSIGKAIPSAEVLVVRPDGTECAPDEPGELVHRGPLVGLGYWNDPARTAERYRPIPARAPGLVVPELAVWSGDTVRRDAEGFLYFVGRRDEMIKTWGYRVSPTEVEEVVIATGLVAEAIATGVPHARLGQAIVVIASPAPGRAGDTDALLAALRQALPSYMVPAAIAWRDALPRNPNGKLDRPRVAAEVHELFAEVT